MFRGLCVSVCVCVCVCASLFVCLCLSVGKAVSSSKKDEQIEVQFGIWTPMGPTNNVLGDVNLSFEPA